MLEVTGGGRARDFEGVRDHAIIRVFTEGVRRTDCPVAPELFRLPPDVAVR